MSAEIIELDDVDGLGTGAVGEPGQRAFYIQARTEHTQLTVLVEKEQVALLATEAVAFLDQIADEYPELPFDLPPTQSVLREPTVPLFRARLIGLGFDPERELVLIELRERARRRGRRATPTPTPSVDDDDDDGYVARIYATRAQVRAMAARGAEAVAGGRPPCPLCEQPMDPVRAPVSSLELTPDELRGALETAELEVVGRMRYSSNATFLVEAKVDGVELAAIYKPRRGERPLWDFTAGHALPPRGRGVRALRRARLGHRAAHRPARRPARRRRGAALRRPRSRRALLHAARRPRRPLPRVRRGSTCSPTTPTARAATACTTGANDVIVGIDHGLCFHDE